MYLSTPFYLHEKLHRSAWCGGHLATCIIRTHIELKALFHVKHPLLCRPKWRTACSGTIPSSFNPRGGRS